MGEQVAAGFKEKETVETVLYKLRKKQVEGLQLSRLERTPDKREVGGSSPLKPS